MVSAPSLPALDAEPPRSVADQVFDLLYARIVALQLPPGTKLSEADVATQLGVSRQPVRDAFFRLSKLGFLRIRPQRATTVAPISRAGVRQAHFIRAALEEATMRHAASRLTEAHFAALDQLLDQQDAAVRADDRSRFHALDDQFHRDIGHHAGVGFGWAVIKDSKGHMDRARFLSLAFAAPRALAEHRQILAALRARDPEGAVAAIRQHLGHIEDIINRIGADRPDVLDRDGA